MMNPLTLGRDRLGSAASIAFAWIAMFAFGGIAVETFLIYPNVFQDPPESLAGATEFFTVTGPADVFPPLGALTVAAAVVAAALTWPVRRVRVWLLISLATLVFGEFLFSVLFFWPRNEIMFDEGAAVHSAEVLRATAAEFTAGHWGRLAMSGVTATVAFVAMLKLQRHRALEARDVAGD